MFFSFKKLPLLSKTQQLLFCPNGSQSWKNSCFVCRWCCKMLLHTGIQPMICWNLLSSIVKHSSRSLGIRRWSWGNMSWWRMIGKSQLSSTTSSKCIIISECYYYLFLDQAWYDRSSRMPPSSSHVVHPTLPLWYLPWTTLMSTPPMQLLIPSIPCWSRPPMLLGRKLSINIMTKQTIQKSFALQWVYFLL